MFNPSGKIFGLHCWHLIDSPANTKILMSYKRTNYSNHHPCVLWRGLGRRGRCFALIFRWLWCLRGLQANKFLGLSRVCSCSVSLPPPLLLLEEQPKPSSKGQEHCIFPLGWQTCPDAALPKVWGFYFILVTLVEQFLIFWLSFRAQRCLEKHTTHWCAHWTCRE